MKLSSFIGAFIITGMSLNAYAIHVDMKPGLWEHSFKFTEGGTDTNAHQEQMTKAMDEMKAQMANLPPAQRKMMGDMMEKQGIKMSDKGIDIAAQGVHIDKNGSTVKACVTQEAIDRGEMPQADKNCEQKITQVSANSFTATYICKGEHPSHGEGEMTFQNNKAYTGKMKFITEVNNKQEVMEGESSGKWLSSDCGTIKPVAPTSN